jgi:hypothetical protein
MASGCAVTRSQSQGADGDPSLQITDAVYLANLYRIEGDIAVSLDLAMRFHVFFS